MRLFDINDLFIEDIKSLRKVLTAHLRRVSSPDKIDFAREIRLASIYFWWLRGALAEEPARAHFRRFRALWAAFASAGAGSAMVTWYSAEHHFCCCLISSFLCARRLSISIWGRGVVFGLLHYAQGDEEWIKKRVSKGCTNQRCCLLVVARWRNSRAQHTRRTEKRERRDAASVAFAKIYISTYTALHTAFEIKHRQHLMTNSLIEELCIQNNATWVTCTTQSYAKEHDGKKIENMRNNMKLNLVSR